MNRFIDATGYQMSTANNLPDDAQRFRTKVESSDWKLSLENDGSIVIGKSADPRGELKAEIEAQIERRNAARKAKNFKESDRIRDELAAKGIVLKDGPQGTTWEVKR
jgi:cysteinyl-tRNA synthetase